MLSHDLDGLVDRIGVARRQHRDIREPPPCRLPGERREQSSGGLVDPIEIVDRDGKRTPRGKLEDEGPERRLELGAVEIGPCDVDHRDALRLGRLLRCGIEHRGRSGVRCGCCLRDRRRGAVNLLRERRGDTERKQRVLATCANGGRTHELRLEHECVEHAGPPRTHCTDQGEAAAVAAHGAHHLLAEPGHDRITTDEPRRDQVRARCSELVVGGAREQRYQPVHHLRGALRTRAHVDPEHAEQQLVERSRHAGNDARGANGTGTPGVLELIEGPGRIGLPPRQGVVERRAQRE